jgi:hypothetical protein
MGTKPIMLAKDSGSGDDGCPSVWLKDGEFVVLGPTADPAELSNVLPGETAARINIDVVRHALAAYDAGMG